MQEGQIEVLMEMSHLSPTHHVQPFFRTISYDAPDLVSLKERIDLALKQQQLPPRIIAYCNTGERSGAVAADLQQKLGVDVLCLCGGIINYFNLGGCVKDRSGAVVQAVHPGSVDIKSFITRPSNFKI